MKGPIGIFDSGFGGLTILKEIVKELPQYDYLYLGDNARAPYGPRSFENVYEYTLQCVNHLFSEGCPLVILACNTASAKALRTIQQNDLPHMEPGLRVLGVIRPTTEMIGSITKTNVIGILGTKGTVQSNSYVVEINKFFPNITVVQQACPMWVPLIENNEHLSQGADYFLKKYIDELFQKNEAIDTVVLGCTHYPLLINKIRAYVPNNVQIISQGSIVAQGLRNYLIRHPEIEANCLKNEQRNFLTTDMPVNFNELASLFYGETVTAKRIHL